MFSNVPFENIFHVRLNKPIYYIIRRAHMYRIIILLLLYEIICRTGIIIYDKQQSAIGKRIRIIL